MLGVEYKLVYTGEQATKEWNGVTYSGEIVTKPCNIGLSYGGKTYLYVESEAYFLPIKGDSFARREHELTN